MVADPEDTPVTVPVLSTEAMAAFVLLQLPPAIEGVSTVVTPGQTVVLPESVPAEGAAETFSDTVALVAPQPLNSE